MKKLLIILLFLPTIALSQDIAIAEPLEDYTWLDTFKSIIGRIYDTWKPINKKLVDGVWPSISGWGSNLKERMEQGWEEEKEEKNQKIVLEIISKSFYTIKNWIISTTGD